MLLNDLDKAHKLSSPAFRNQSIIIFKLYKLLIAFDNIIAPLSVSFSNKNDTYVKKGLCAIISANNYAYSSPPSYTPICRTYNQFHNFIVAKS